MELDAKITALDFYRDRLKSEFAAAAALTAFFVLFFRIDEGDEFKRFYWYGMASLTLSFYAMLVVSMMRVQIFQAIDRLHRAKLSEDRAIKDVPAVRFGKGRIGTLLHAFFTYLSIALLGFRGEVFHDVNEFLKGFDRGHVRATFALLLAEMFAFLFLVEFVFNKYGGAS